VEVLAAPTRKSIRGGGPGWCSVVREVTASMYGVVLGYGVKEEATDVVRQRKEEEGDMRLCFARVEED